MRNSAQREGGREGGRVGELSFSLFSLISRVDGVYASDLIPTLEGYFAHKVLDGGLFL